MTVALLYENDTSISTNFSIRIYFYTLLDNNTARTKKFYVANTDKDTIHL